MTEYTDLIQNKQPTQEHNNTKEKSGDVSCISRVTGKQLKFRARVPEEERIKYIEANYGFKTPEEFALDCGVHYRTILSDLSKWRSSARFREWLKDNWAILFRKDTVPDSEKFRALSNMLGKSLDAEINTDGSATRLVLSWAQPPSATDKQQGSQ